MLVLLTIGLLLYSKPITLLLYSIIYSPAIPETHSSGIIWVIGIIAHTLHTHQLIAY